jgi:hypothetical protein
MLWLRGIVLRKLRRARLFFVFALFSLLLAPSAVEAAGSFEEAAKLLPDRLGEYRAFGEPRPPADESANSNGAEALSTARRVYRLANGEEFNLTITKTRSDSAAYAMLTSAVRFLEPSDSGIPRIIKLGEAGTASIVLPDRVLFFKGLAFVVVELKSRAGDASAPLDFARLFAESLDKGEGDIPVLVKHLPDWEKTHERVLYAMSLDSLKSATGNRPVLDAVSFEGGAEAVTATYGASRLVIVEYHTPQQAVDADARINERLRQLREAGQPLPSAYRRVGNYSVFVFDAPDERTANQLIDQISYEQVVQWLGTNPHILERLQREYHRTTAGVIVAVLKASGLSLILCFGIGGLFGFLVFRRRRAQQVAAEAFSDAGGIVRLNIDEMTPQSNPSRLLSRGDS